DNGSAEPSGSSDNSRDTKSGAVSNAAPPAPATTARATQAAPTSANRGPLDAIEEKAGRPEIGGRGRGTGNLPAATSPPSEIPRSSPGMAITARRSGDVFQDCPDCPEMVVIPEGKIVMGS